MLVLEASRDPLATVKARLCRARPEAVPRPRYKVLSYDWGDPAKTKPIFVNGAIANVTRNLESGLRHLRHRDEPRCVWADPLCIDHRHGREQGSSFEALRFIYARAEEVVVWLGDKSETSTRAFRFFRAFDQENIAGQCYLVQEELRHPDIIPRSLLGLGAVLKLMERRWWHRAGLVQHLARGCRVSVHCGDSSAEWRVFARLFEVLQEKEPLVRGRNMRYVGKIFQAIYILPPEIVGKLGAGGIAARSIDPEAFLRFTVRLLRGPKVVVSWVLALSVVTVHFGPLLSGIADKICNGSLDRVRTALFRQSFREDSPEPADRKQAQISAHVTSHGPGSAGSDNHNVSNSDLAFWLRVLEELQAFRSNIVVATRERSADPRTTTQFRILRLKPTLQEPDGGRSDPQAQDQIRCELIPVDFHLLSVLGIRKCPFICVSRRLAEQPSQGPGSIVLQGVEKAVSSSLFADLRALRHASHDTLLWMEPICADDGSKSEYGTSSLKDTVEGLSGYVWTEDDNLEVASSAYEAPLCMSCKTIPWSQILEDGLEEGPYAPTFSPRLATVRESAASGCSLCSLVWHSLRHNPARLPSTSAGAEVLVAAVAEQCPCLRNPTSSVYILQESGQFLKVAVQCRTTNRGAIAHVASLPLSASAFEGE